MILLVDGGNLAMRCLFSSADAMADESFRLFKYIYFRTLFLNIKEFTPNEVVLAMDGKGNWRHSVYPEYKKSRKKKRDDSPVNFRAFFEIYREFSEKIKSSLPIKVIDLEKVEADDIISVISRKGGGEKVILSTDNDFTQLLHLKDVKLFNPLKGEWVTSDDPRLDLFEKILAGDPGDEVPPVRKGVGKKTARKIAKQGAEGIKRWIIHEGLEAEFRRNFALVNLLKIPSEIENRVLETYEEYTLPDPNGISEFVYDSGFRWFIDRIDMTEGILLSLH